MDSGDALRRDGREGAAGLRQMAERARTEDLCLVLEAELSQRFGRAVSLREIRRKSLARASRFAAERISVVLKDGASLIIFFKDLFHSARGRAVSVSQLERGYRELTVYRHLLAGRPFNTPRLHGSLWEPQRARCWLFLEWVSGPKLSRAANVDAWRTAARWAARFHVRSRAIPPAELASLPRQDQMGYGVNADGLRSRLPDITAPDRRLIEESLSRYESLRNRFDALPQSPVHGEFFPANIIVRRDVAGPDDGAIALIDWETSAIGPSYLDIVSLTSGHAPAMREDLLRAYFDEYQADGVLEWERFCEDVRIVEFLHGMKWLSWFACREVSRCRRSVKWIEELRGIREKTPPRHLFS